jgi:hypothetical protein
VFWALLYTFAMAATAMAWITDAVTPAAGLLAMLPVSVVLVPVMLRSALWKAQRSGTMSAAVVRYTRRFLRAMVAYVMGLGVAAWLHQQGMSGQGASVVLALLPAVPTLAMVWTMARYLAEEEDEYLRHRAVEAALAGLGGVLALGSFWGFLETFGVVPHVWAWWVVPVWAIGMGLWQAFAAARDR